MLENTSQGAHGQLASLEPTTLRSARNWLLSAVPVNFALGIAKRVGAPTVEKEGFKEFIQELEEGLVSKVGSSKFLGKLIPIYLTETLRRKMYTGDLVEFNDQMQFDLTQAYNSTINQEMQQQYKQQAFQRIMLKLGPHGLKFIQNMRPKDPNSWIAKVIASAQTDLPTPSIQEFEEMLKNSFKEQGSLDYVSKFSELCKVKKFYGAGTIGITALVEFKLPNSPQEKPRERVVKIVRPNSLQNFLIDHECFSHAAEQLLAEKQITPQEAKSFKDFNNMLTESELRELNLNLEAANLASDPYNQSGVCETVKCDLELTGKAHNVLIMDVATGVPLSKYLQQLSLSLANASTASEKEPLLLKTAELRGKYSKLALLHYKRATSNQSIHTDLHPGNVFYDDTSHSFKILDLGSMTHHFEPAEHLKLNRFLLAINLSLATADSHFLRLYYQNATKEEPRLSMEQMEPMLTELQTKLDRLKIATLPLNVIDVDASSDMVMGVITDAILAQGVHIVPNALFHMAKANAPVSDALDSMKHMLANSSSASAIPYGERTQFALALRASLQTRSTQAWTQESWDYFSKSLLSPKAGLAQLQFEKKFIYGILGLSEKEAKYADYLIPSTIIAAPMVVYLTATVLKKAVTKLAIKMPEVIDSYQLMQKLQNMYQTGKMSKNDAIRQMKEFFERSTQRYRDMNWRPQAKNTPSSKGITLTTELGPHIPRVKLSGNHRFFTGFCVGAAAVKILDDYCSPKPQ